MITNIIIIFVILDLRVLVKGEVELGRPLQEGFSPHDTPLLNDLVEPLDHRGVQDDKEEGGDDPYEHLRQDDIDQPGILAHHFLLIHNCQELPALRVRHWGHFIITITNVSVINNIAEQISCNVYVV